MTTPDAADGVQIDSDVGTQCELAAVVKGVHRRLRTKLRTALCEGRVSAAGNAEDAAWDSVWAEHCHDADELGKYAQAMHQLASNVWQDQGQSRLTWCVNTCKEYFEADSGLFKVLQKEFRRRHGGKTCDTVDECAMEWEHQMAPLTIPCQCPIHSAWFYSRTIPGGIRMLDVGSCYNPFAQFEGFVPTAIDLCPGEQSTLQCDFTQLVVSFCEDCESKLSTLKSPVTMLPMQTYHCVTFCLFLSYLPSAKQRWLCCVKAYHMLMPNGLLLITTPDSSHVGRHAQLMKSWKMSIEEIGFSRWRYEKLEHLHCMAFRRLPSMPCRSQWHKSLLADQLLLPPAKAAPDAASEAVGLSGQPCMCTCSYCSDASACSGLPIPQDTTGADLDDSGDEVYAPAPRTTYENKQVADVFNELPCFDED